MALNKQERERLRAHCGELHDDDGVDPREYFQPHRSRDRDGRKTQQLCRQVQRILEQIFSGEIRDELLDSLRIVSVTSTAPSTLQVTLVADLPPERFDRKQIEARLDELSGWLRTEVAGAITRKRTPLLIFHLVGSRCEPPASRPEESR